MSRNALPSAVAAEATAATAPPGASTRQRFFRVPAASERVADWHVSPAVDMLAYHFSWLGLLIPLLLLGDRHFADYFAFFLLLMVANFVHRHFTLPYVYLDAEIFRRFPLRFTLTPILVIAAVLLTPSVDRSTLPAGALALGDASWPTAPISGSIGVAAVILATGLWNFWHVQMQKFGILRLYATKVQARTGVAIPRWVDKLFLLAWLPFLILHLGTRYREVALSSLSEVGRVLPVALDAVAAVKPWLWIPSQALLLAAIAIYFGFEWRVSRFRNAPRLSMGIAMVALSACFLVVNPVKVYMAYAFSHAVEYMVFVWAFQRRRYSQPRDSTPRLARLLRRPWLAYPIFAGGLAALLLMLHGWGGLDYWGVPRIELGGTQIGLWIFYWSVYQSLMHFYFDGFLWKARRPDYRATL